MCPVTRPATNAKETLSGKKQTNQRTHTARCTLFLAQLSVYACVHAYVDKNNDQMNEWSVCIQKEFRIYWICTVYMYENGSCSIYMDEISFWMKYLILDILFCSIRCCHIRIFNRSIVSIHTVRVSFLYENMQTMNVLERSDKIQLSSHSELDSNRKRERKNRADDEWICFYNK